MASTNNNKPRVIKDYEKLDAAIQERIKEAFPNGYGNALISITNKDGMLISALPFETDDRYYLVKMPVREAKIIEEEDDFVEDVFIKDSSKPDLDAEFKDEFGSGDDEAEESDEDADEDFDDEDDDVADETEDDEED